MKSLSAAGMRTRLSTSQFSAGSTGTRPAIFPVLSTSAQSHALAQAKSRGFTQGHAAGYVAGLKLAATEAAAIAEQADAELTARAAALETAKAAELATLVLVREALVNRTTPVVADVEQALFRHALELAEAIVGYTLRDGESSARAALARAVALDEIQVPVGIRMNPEDIAALTGDHSGLPDGVALCADPTLSRGDAMADYPDGFLDARLSTAAGRAAAALLGDSLPVRLGAERP